MRSGQEEERRAEKKLNSNKIEKVNNYKRKVK